jgi:hypothetical protein
MNKIYKIDEFQLTKIANRAFFRVLRIYGIATLLMFALMYPQRQFYFQYPAAFSYIFGLLLMIVVGFISTRKLKATFRTLEIILSSTGVEVKAQMSPYKQILWSNLVVEEKNNGFIYLYDQTVSSTQRKWNGKGAIIIQPEIQNREALLNDLLAHRYHC